MEDRDDVLVEIGGKKYIPDSLESVCRWWIATYPDDIFVVNPKEIVEIREKMKEILQQVAKKKYMIRFRDYVGESDKIFTTARSKEEAAKWFHEQFPTCVILEVLSQGVENE